MNKFKETVTSLRIESQQNERKRNKVVCIYMNEFKATV